MKRDAHLFLTQNIPPPRRGNEWFAKNFPEGILRSLLRNNSLLFTYLLMGILLKLFLTSGGHFIFHMDVARDFLDVREMFLLHKLRLIGPTSAIDGLFTGPGWYYFLSIPYFLSSGNPYSGVVLMILAWASGGFFLIKIISRWGVLPTIVGTCLWLSSDLIKLTTSYSFHPNLITLLTPIFIYFLSEYLTTEKTVNLVWASLLGGLFFQFEMNFGIFIPLIILSSIFIFKRKLLKTKKLWVGLLLWFITLIPQITFDIRNHFFMSQSTLNFLNHTPQEQNLFNRVSLITTSFYNIFFPILLNSKALTNTILIILAITWLTPYKRLKGRLDSTAAIAICMIAIPFLGLLLLPVNVNSWHLGGSATAFIFLVCLIAKTLNSLKRWGQASRLILVAWILILSISHLSVHIQERKNTTDPSLFLNETRAIDYVYKQAMGKNFKVYTYLPSVYDYPYQYLFPWYGLKKYSYLPKDYAYLPHKPTYIKAKDKITSSYPPDSSLIFLLKEPDEAKRRELWENNFAAYPLLKTALVGPITIETRQDLTDF